MWEGIPLAMVGQRTIYALNSFPLMAVPIFIFVGNLMNSSGITTRIYRFADTAFGRLPGGLAQVNIAGSLIFSGMSGAALADVGGLGRVELKAMKEHGFNPAFASALTCASAIVGPIFPPSIPLIIYASVASISSVQLLLAGIGPAPRLRRHAVDHGGAPSASLNNYPALAALADPGRSLARLRAGLPRPCSPRCC